MLNLLTYRVVVGPLVFGTIRAVAEGLGAALKLALVRPLARVRSLVDFQILQAGEGLVAAGELIRAIAAAAGGRKGREKNIENYFRSETIENKSRI